MIWLEKNLAINEASGIFSANKHQSFVLPVERALKKLIKAEEKFSMIICDPPPLISIEKKKVQAMAFYEKYLPEIVRCLAPGGRLLIVLNTHNIKVIKFQNKIMEILSKGKDTKLKLEREMKMGEDCPQLQGFPEGHYLKGFLFSN
jgi:23S rRNA G2069 N7-methylase RlmK/C1962 C5-methylase RlmI